MVYKLAFGAFCCFWNWDFKTEEKTIKKKKFVFEVFWLLSRMENVQVQVKEDEQLDLPPGFRFHPTDEELISHYLYKKVVDINFACRAIGEVDLNKCEPWDLPCKFSSYYLFIYLFCFFYIMRKEMVFSFVIFKKKMFFFFQFLLCFREGENGRKRVVFFLCKGQEIPNWAEDKQSNRSRVLESHRERQRDLQRKIPCWHEENLGFLQRKSPERRKIQLGHARVQARRQILHP